MFIVPAEQNSSLSLLIPGLIMLGIIIVLVVAYVFIWKKRKKIRHSTDPITLRSFIDKRQQPLSANEAVSLLMPVAIQIRDMHDDGETHLQISPDSIQLTADGPKLLPVTVSESSKYSSGFAAPEVYHGKSNGNVSDIYSFSAILFFAVAGTPPENALERTARISSEGENVDNVFAIADEEYEDVLQHIDNDFKATINKGMASNAASRFETMQTLIYKLTPYNTGHAGELTGTISNVAPETATGVAKKHRRISVKILVSASIAVILIAFAGTYFLCYRKAVSLTENGSYDNAQQYLFLPSVTELHDDNIIEYINAGLLLDSRKYEDACTSFSSLTGYLNAEEMVQESYYRQAAQLADTNEFEKSIQIYTELSDAGYKDTSELLLNTQYRMAAYQLYELGEFTNAAITFYNLSAEGYENADVMWLESQYWWACSMLDEYDYINAYNIFDGIRGYADTEELLITLSDIIYLEGQTAYYDGRHFDSEDFFECITPYLNSEDYLELIDVQMLGGLLNTSNTVDTLIDLFYFEDASELLVSNTSLACKFLLGTWHTSGGSYYFKMEVSDSNDYDYYSSYNIPWYGGTFSIKDGIYYVTTNSGIEKPQYKFTLISPNSMDLYCYKNGYTYTLYR